MGDTSQDRPPLVYPATAVIRCLVLDKRISVQRMNHEYQIHRPWNLGVLLPTLKRNLEDNQLPCKRSNYLPRFQIMRTRERAQARRMKDRIQILSRPLLAETNSPIPPTPSDMTLSKFTISCE